MKRLGVLLVLALPAPACWSVETSVARSATVDDDLVIDTLNEGLRRSWREAGVVPSKPAPDDAWARRLYLDLVGRTPTVDELALYADQPRGERRRWLVDRLLGEPYRDERSRWLATEWANLLVGRTGGRSNDSLVVREPFEKMLAEHFASGAGHDVLARRLVTATGSVRPEDDDFNPAANFLADKLEENGVQATAATARVFLGLAVQCTQCHDHPFNDVAKQSQFWELNAFFRQTALERLRDAPGDRPKARVLERDFYGEGRGPEAVRMLLPGQPEEAPAFYELRNGRVAVAYPTFVDGVSLADLRRERGRDDGNSGRLALVNRRAELAGLVAASPDFARAAVNREWARHFGHGFTRPTDDMGSHNPPSHPEALDDLAAAFRATGLDLGRLTRWIVLSEAYGLDSRAGRSNESDDPSLGEAPLFSRFYLRPLSPEQVFESLLTATRADETLTAERRAEARRRWTRQFADAFGNDENGESTSFNGSIPQALAMMNSELMRRATELRWAGEAAYDSLAGAKKPGGFLSEVAADSSLTNPERVERLYLAALARRPDRRELTLCNELLAARDGDVGEALRDVWWALLNSSEFVLQH